jgi:hypothetical protein
MDDPDDAELGGDLEAFESRADYIHESDLPNVTSRGDWFDAIHKALLSPRIAVIVGPRGCGKTHMMRYTWLECRQTAKEPFAVYVTFNRYLRLEPWMQRRADARRLFNAWVLALIVDATIESLEGMGEDDFPLAPNFSFGRDRLKLVIERLESHIAGEQLTREDEDAVRELTIARVTEVLRRAYRQAGRTRAVILLDDAALTLTPEFLVEFFEVVRTIKQTDIAPKCSVYPGTTQYGPRFHPHQDALVAPAWLSIENPKYREIMETIIRLRNPSAYQAVQAEVSHLLMYAAFGVPRAYLVMMGKMAKAGKQTQAEINRILQEHATDQRNEFRSIEQKLPQFRTLIHSGEAFFNRIVDAVVKDNVDNAGPKGTKQLVIGIEAKEFPALATRMIKFLIEAGLLYEYPEVKHGEDRTYRRYTPHMTALLRERAFSSRTHGVSTAAVVEYIERPRSKHPVRRNLATLLSPEQLGNLKFDLPACPECGAARLNETQKFCHECASPLPQSSTYHRLMALKIDEVTVLTTWARGRLKAHGIETIQDLMSIPDPGAELRNIYRVGPARSTKIITTLESYVNEALLT